MPPQSPTPSALLPAASQLHLRSGGLRLVRGLWLAVVAASLTLFASGLPRLYEDVRAMARARLGLSLALRPTGELVVSPWSPAGSGGQDFPALQAGILEGDILVAVNGVPVHAQPGQPLDELLPSGPAGTPVRLTVRTGDHAPRDYTLYLGGTNAVTFAQLGLSEDFTGLYEGALEMFFALTTVAIAAVIVWRKSRDPLAWLFSGIFILALLGATRPLVTIYNSGLEWRPVLDVWGAAVLFALPLFLFLFPNGRFVPRWTLGVVLAWAGWLLVQIWQPSLFPWRLPQPAGFLTLLPWVSAGVLAQIVRYARHSSPIQRQQTKWVFFGASAATVGLLGMLFPVLSALPPGLPIALNQLLVIPAMLMLRLLLPLTIAIAILRYRLWDIDLILNRTLVYGSLTALIAGLYVLLVGALGTAIQARGSLLVSVVATGLVAALFQPLRERLQRAVNRLMYGERDDPVTVLSRLGQRLEATVAPDAVLPALVETVAQALKLPYVAITLGAGEGAEVAAAYGVPPVGELTRLPLVHQGELVGQLAVAPRAPGEPLNPADRHLLENIAHQAGVAVHAVRLTAELQRSRQRLVSAREEERRRLRRDLHDGLGPNLASQRLILATVQQLLESDPASAAPLVEQVMAQNKATVDEIRRLVYDLRPPALDELGLVAAIRQQLLGLDGHASLQLELSQPPEGLPALTAAVEVAAYRIALEAVTNVMRHARAQHCTVRLSVAEAGARGVLQIDVEDDGVGLPAALRAGIGLHSMRERAEEVGGSLAVEPAARGGTHLCARLPLADERAARAQNKVYLPVTTNTG